jgi:large subunit ribosomal protein L17
MRHRVAGFKLGRDTEHRKAMFRNLAIALFTHGQIETTIPKAKAVKPFVEKLITAAKKGDLAARRRVIKALGNPILVDRDLKDFDRKELRAEGYIVNKFHELQRGPRVVAKLFDEIAKDYDDREGGYTRIIKLAKRRLGDASQLCVLQLVGNEEGPQVSGSSSRRRQKADSRTVFAAKLRKQKSGDSDDTEVEAEEEVVEAATEAPADEAVEETTAEAPAVEATEEPAAEEEKKED